MDHYAGIDVSFEEFARAGTEVVFLNRPIGRSPEDDLLLQLQGMFAEYERARMLERSRRGKRHLARAGVVSVLSRAPHGYRYVALYAPATPGTASPASRWSRTRPRWCAGSSAGSAGSASPWPHGVPVALRLGPEIAGLFGSA